MIDYISFRADQPDHLSAMTAVLNTACSPHLEITPRLVDFNTQATSGIITDGCLAWQDGQAAGAVLVTAPRQPSPESHLFPPQGWIEAMAVLPAYQRHGIGRALLQWAEGWLLDHGCETARLGAGMRPFAPGLPVELGTLPFFERYGWETSESHSFDLARLISGTEPFFTLSPERRAMLRFSQPARPEDKDHLLGFLAREFPGRWWFECQEILAEGGDISDYILTWTDDPDSGRGEIASFVRLTFEDSLWPADRYYPQRLPRPWSALGTVGTASKLRGQGYSAVTIYTGLERLRSKGVQSCVIDWTGLVDFYGKFGFHVYREYYPLFKALK
jgi:GNAT superfamily N-acetyltransferase